MKNFDVGILLRYWPLLLDGAWLTARICAVAFVMGYAIGILVALLSLVPSRPLRAIVTAYLVCLRAVPFIILLFLVYYGMPFAGVRAPAFVTGTIALALFASAYYAEIVRAAIVALPRGQFESARVIGMSPLEAMRHIIFPQIVPALLPPSTNMTLTMVKESAVLSSITVPELTYQGLVIQGNTFAPFEAFAAVTVIYWAVTIAVARAIGLVERRVGRSRREQVDRNGIAASFLSFRGGAAR